MTDFSARILADGISPDNVRLITIEATFPRFILAEVNTHRMLSRNSASSRAIPPEKHIERIMEHPFVPLTFNKRVKGMGVGEALEGDDALKARQTWLWARDAAVQNAERLLTLDCDKSRVNRLLEPFMWHTAIISATDLANFFALRDHPDAQPEFQKIAAMMRTAIRSNKPYQIDYDQWHLPLITHDEWSLYPAQECKMVSVRRCARVSFDKHTDREPWHTSIERAEQLMQSGHLSPFEHVARPTHPNEAYNMRGSHSPETDYCGNFRGWTQMRKEVPHEDNFALVLEDQKEKV